MIIDGKLGTYKVKLEQDGWTYAIPVLYKKKKIPLLPICRWVKVWEGNSKDIISAKRILPGPLNVWIKETVHKYEEYVLAWRDNVPAD